MLPDGNQALLVDGGRIDGGRGFFLANAGDDVHAVGPLDPIFPGYVGCIVIAAEAPPNGSRGARPAGAEEVGLVPGDGEQAGLS